MTLAQLRYLLAIVDAGLNITVAAERLHATQPGLSKQLKLLEDQLGLRLFVRRSRNLERLTPAGEEIVRRARRVVAEVDGIRRFALDQRTAGDGTLHIETTPILASYVLPAALETVQARFPGLDIKLGFAADLLDCGALTGGADLALFSTDGAAPAGEINLPLFTWHSVALVRPDHPLLTGQEPLSLARLSSFPLVTYDSSRTGPLSIARAFGDAGLSPRFAMLTKDASLIKASVRAGAGVGIVAEMAVDPMLDADLHSIPLAAVLPRCTAWAVLRRDCVLRDSLIHLISALAGHGPLNVRRALAGDVPLDSVFSPPRAWSGAPRPQRRDLRRPFRPSTPALQHLAA